MDKYKGIDDCPIRKRLTSKMRFRWRGYFCPWTEGKHHLCLGNCTMAPLMARLVRVEDIIGLHTEKELKLGDHDRYMQTERVEFWIKKY